LAVQKDSLWPANRKFVEVRLDYVVFDSCDADPSVLIEVTSDEPTATDAKQRYAPDAKLRDGTFKLGLSVQIC